MIKSREEWNEQHKALRAALNGPERLEEAKNLFLGLHAPLHAASVSNSEDWNLEEELWQGLTEAEFRLVPAKEEHSIAWCLWHLARIEDVTMNILAANGEQVFIRDGWQERLHSPLQDTGNEITPEEMLQLSKQVDFEEVRAYRSAVGRQTCEVVAGLIAADLKRKTPTERLQRLLEEGAVFQKSQGVLDYWAGLTVSGLLLMPPTRHNLVHINECLELKHKAKRQLESGYSS